MCMKKKKRFSPWEFDEIVNEEPANEDPKPTEEAYSDEDFDKDLDDVMGDEGKEELGDDPNTPEKPDASPDDGEDPNDAPNDELSDDDVVFKLDDGTEVTRKEASEGYMRQSDYTKKTQELSELKNKSDEEKAKEISENPEKYSKEDVETAEYFMKILKDKHGLMTKEDYDAEVAKEKATKELENNFSEAEKYVKDLKIKPPTREELVDYMKKNEVYNPVHAIKLMKQDDIIQSKIANTGRKKTFKTETPAKPSNKVKDAKDMSDDDFVNDLLDNMETE